MRQNNKIQRSYRVIKYKAYTALLEGRINQREHDVLVELGFLDKVKSFFGGGMEVGGDLAKLFKDKVAQKQLQLAKDNIAKAVADLKSIASKAGVDESVINEFLKGVLDEAGADPAEIASAKPSGGEAGEAGGAEAKPGTPVTADAVKQNPAVLTRVVADATGKPEEAVAAELEKKKPDVAALSAVLGNAIGKSAGVDGKIVTDVVKVLIDKGHLKLENGSPLTRRGLMNFVNEATELNRQHDLMERWQHLAGVGQSSFLLAEIKVVDLIKDIESGKIKDETTFGDALKSFKTDEEKKELKDKMGDISGALKKKKVKIDDKKIASMIGGDPSAGEGKQPSAEDQKKAEEVKKEFGPAFKDVRAAIDPKNVDDATLAKVIDAIDGFKSVAIAA